MGLRPGRKSGEGSKVIVDGGGCHSIVTEALLPGEDIATQTGRDSLVTVGCKKKRLKPLEMKRDLLGYRLRANARYGKLAIVLHPLLKIITGRFQKC